MRTIVKGKNIDVRPADRQYAQTKMRRLERILDDRSDVILEFSVEHHRSVEGSRIVEATLVVNGQPLRGVAHAATHRAAVDTLVDKLERRTIALKEKPRVAARTVRERTTRTARVARAARTLPAQSAAIREAETLAGEPEKRERPAIVKVKRFGIEPMFEEDAVARMEELGHHFFVFVNAENERLCVLYRRSDGLYGLIEPVIGGEYSENGRSPRRRSARRIDSKA